MKEFDMKIKSPNQGAGGSQKRLQTRFLLALTDDDDGQRPSS